MTEVEIEDRVIAINSGLNINLKAIKKNKDISDLDKSLKTNIKGILYNPDSKSSSGSFNTVFSFPDEDRYVLRMMHWNPKWGDMENRIYYKTENSELEGLKVQSEIYHKCKKHTCKIYEYGTFDFGKRIFCKTISTHGIEKDIYVKKGVYAILEKCGMDLVEYMNQPNWESNKTWYHLTILETISESKIIIRQVLEALKCLHTEYEHIHRDIKFDNIMIKKEDGKIQCKLIDFGFITKIGTGMKPTNVIRGTREWIHPNAIGCEYIPNYCTTFQPNIDIWAVGILLYKLIWFDVPENLKSGCNILVPKPVSSKCGLTKIPDVIKVTDYFKDYINNQNDLNDINNYIYLLYIIFYQNKSITDILRCNFFKMVSETIKEEHLDAFEAIQGTIDLNNFVSSSLTSSAKPESQSNNECQALVWSEDLPKSINQNDLIKLDREIDDYRSIIEVPDNEPSLEIKDKLSLKKKFSELLKKKKTPWSNGWFNVIINNHGPQLEYYDSENEYYNSVSPKDKLKLTPTLSVERINSSEGEFSITSDNKTWILRSTSNEAMEKWILYLEKFKNKPSILKNNLQEDENGNISWNNCSDFTSMPEVSGGRRKKTKKGNNKRYLKKTRRRKYKKRKRKTMYKKKLYTRKR